MQQTEVILFDLGGVLIELVGIPTMLEWTGNQYSEEELWGVWLESPTVRGFETGAIGIEEFGERIVTELNMPVSAEEFIEAFTYWPKGLYPNVLALLDRLRERYTLACLSNTNALHWPRIMSEMELEGKFDHYFASHLLGALKPDQVCFKRVIQELDCEASAILFLDDNQINITAAEQAGMSARLVKGHAEVESVLGPLLK